MKYFPILYAELCNKYYIMHRYEKLQCQLAILLNVAIIVEKFVQTRHQSIVHDHKYSLLQ